MDYDCQAVPPKKAHDTTVASDSPREAETRAASSLARRTPSIGVKASGLETPGSGWPANIGIEGTLWLAADELRGSMPPAITANLKGLGYGG